jgi:hypothetical protein
LLPGLAGAEPGVVAFLHLEQALGRYFPRRERVGQAGRHEGQVALVGLGDLIADQQLDRAADDVEQLTGFGVMVRVGASVRTRTAP